MAKFLIDEDVPRSTARLLQQQGFDAEDVRDVGLRGHSDSDVFSYAQENNRTLITCDKGFSNLLRFPSGSHAGIMVVRIPDEYPIDLFNREVLSAIKGMGEEPLFGVLVIVEIGHTRIRRN